MERLFFKESLPDIYKKYRGKIHDGDILLYSGRKIFSRLIRRITGSYYSHAGIAVWWHKRLMVMETLSSGLSIRTMSRSVGRYNGHVDLFVSAKKINEKRRLRMVLLAQEELGKKYSYLGMIETGIRKILKLPGRDNPLVRSEKLICSQFVAMLYNSIGIDLKKNEDDRFTIPDDIAHSPVMRKKYRLK